MSEAKAHWQKVYTERKPDEVSWFQEEPMQSLAMIESAALPKSAGILDMGGGASRLVDRLLERGYENLTVLDISSQALLYAQERLGPAAEKVRWIEADATIFAAPMPYDLWHDRAVFHFLTSAGDRTKYLDGLNHGLRPGGTLIIAAFAPDGPEKCSGLPVCRYGADSMAAELGAGFELLETAAESHPTPWDTQQRFNYFRFKKLVA